eukprot:NODE_31896_length_387_cov_3.069231.p2 GENE.NODE_31896_length_387_cov_3.069231~~NODE_31896_length_387_cov_3.069231.p2  ORF type:complete len:92 (+),score=27.73 NODE_31896_length_387_cov_3.069231:84-359(+)
MPETTMTRPGGVATGSGDSSVVVLPSCLFHVGSTQREQDLLSLPPPSCSPSPGSQAIFQLRSKSAMGANTGFGSRNVAAAVSARKTDIIRR